MRIRTSPKIWEWLWECDFYKNLLTALVKYNIIYSSGELAFLYLAVVLNNGFTGFFTYVEKIFFVVTTQPARRVLIRT